MNPGFKVFLGLLLIILLGVILYPFTTNLHNTSEPLVKIVYDSNSNDNEDYMTEDVALRITKT